MVGWFFWFVVFFLVCCFLGFFFNKPERLWMPHAGGVPGQVQWGSKQRGLLECVSAFGRGIGTR